ncbi:hypothetical protein DL96DRAFT_350100 [Flagelloscypha sp. PMI_526]|nr:hypothetical protein DL96DRAFT_350100 [Flagelloscypha sp. PMI_526]
MTLLGPEDTFRILKLPRQLVEGCSRDVSSDDAVEALFPRLDDILADTKCSQQLLESLKGHVREVSKDLAAIPSSNATSMIERQNITRLFWAVILAISLGYKNKKRVFKCLVQILAKVHESTKLLRRMPEVNSIAELDALSMAIIRLLSCAVPQRFLIFFRRSTHPDKIFQGSEVQSYLDDLSDQVRSVQVQSIAAVLDVNA